MSAKSLLITGSLLLALAVGLGAFGAHIIEGMLTPARYEVYQTGVTYHFYHSLGLLITGLLSLHFPYSRWIRLAGTFMFSGILIFSGSLYLLTLTDTPWLGIITPFGGLSLILSWIFLVLGIVKQEI